MVPFAVSSWTWSPDGVAVLEDCHGAGDHVLDEVLSAESEGDAEEPGPGQDGEWGGAEEVERDERCDDEDDCCEVVPEHSCGCVGALVSAFVGGWWFADSFETLTPKAFRALRGAYGSANQGSVETASDPCEDVGGGECCERGDRR